MRTETDCSMLRASVDIDDSDDNGDIDYYNDEVDDQGDTGNVDDECGGDMDSDDDDETPPPPGQYASNLVCGPLSCQKM